MIIEELLSKTNNKVYINLPVPELVEAALKNHEGVLSDSGALVVRTGKYTGRAPKDRFIVDQKSVHANINWGDVNLPIEEDIFEELFAKVLKHLENREKYVFNGFAGAVSKYRMPIRVICELASQALFANQIFIRPSRDELKDFTPVFNVICAPNFKADPKVDKVNSEAFIIINFDKKIVLIGGTQYSGEIKKSIFSIMNYLLPLKGVLPMHCSANIGKLGDTAVFFGLSGTGKTTLSADPERRLIGDDEHGWYDEGVFNFEGGCYAKTIKLSKEKEKEIFDAIKFGTILENVILKENRIPDYDDASLSENTRAAYPVNYISNVEPSLKGNHPNTIIFLTADAFGVLPPISKLTKEAAMYHFMSGYTSKLAGTEEGVNKPKATFSACFGEPFMLLNPAVYAKLLGEKIESYGAEVYLVNTGWIGGPYGIGERIKLSYTRTMVKAAIEGKLKNIKYHLHPIFKVLIPDCCEGVPSEILNPMAMWKNKDEYISKAEELALGFRNNFNKFTNVEETIKNAGAAADKI